MCRTHLAAIQKPLKIGFRKAIQMLYYKFLNDKKGELSQLLIAAQSPNKVSRRVILDISIPVCIGEHFCNQ